MGSNGSSPRIAENQAMTGQRNEISVLFSLSNLQALATGSGSAPASTRPKAGMAQGEGSGLIDIRALASATASVSERPNGHSKDRVEDLLAVGSVNSTFSASTLAAPVAAEKPDRSKFLLLAMGAAILCLGGAVTYLAVREPSATATAAVAPTAPAAQAAVAAPTAPVPTAAAAEAPSEPATAAAGDKGSSDDGSKAKAHDDRDSRDRKADKGHKTGGGSSAEAAPKAAEKSEAAAPTSKPSSSGDKSIDDLLNSALGGASGAKPAKAATPAKPAGADLPQTPSRDDVISAMKGVSGAVSACANGSTGVAMCKITVTGATGKVSNVDVSGPMAGTPVASCITRAVSKAKFDKFSQSTFSVAYPFKL